MKRKMVLGTVVIGLLSVSSFGLIVTPGGSGSFEVVGPAATFTDWALGGGATRGGDSGVIFETYSNTYTNGTTISGSNTSSGSAWLTIPFQFSSPLETAKIYFNSEINGYGNNWGASFIYVVMNGVETLVYAHGSPDYVSTSGMNPADVYYNYNGAAPSGGGIFCTSTDITSLVQGNMSFSLKFVSALGWSQWLYGGGVFMASDATSPDFKLAGNIVPEPVTMGLMLIGGLLGFRRKQS